jgi:hypothetical protein
VADWRFPTTFDHNLRYTFTVFPVPKLQTMKKKKKKKKKKKRRRRRRRRRRV